MPNGLFAQNLQKMFKTENWTSPSKFIYSKWSTSQSSSSTDNFEFLDKINQKMVFLNSTYLY